MVFPLKAIVCAGVAGTVVLLAGYPKWMAATLSFVGFLGLGGFGYCQLVYRTLPRDIKFILKFATIFKEMRRVKKSSLYFSDAFQETVQRNPNKVAILFENRKMTFKELDEFSNKIANLLRTTTGLKRGDSMAIFMENCPEFIAAYLALSKIGVIGAFINHHLRGKSLAHCLRSGHCLGIIYGSELSEALSAVLPEMDPAVSQMLYSVGGQSSIYEAKSLETAIEKISPDKPPPVPDKSDTDCACYIYTSGTTGFPKACNIRHSRFFIAMYGVGIITGIKPQDVVYVSLPLYHMTGGVLGAGQMLSRGTTLALRRKFSASKFWEDCIKYKCTVFIYIGEMCRYLMTQPIKEIDNKHSIRIILGNGLRDNVWSSFHKRFQIDKIIEYYASTEGNCTFININSKEGSIGSLSRVLPFMNSGSLIKVNPETGEYIRNKKGFCIEARINEPGEVIGKIVDSIPSTTFGGYTDLNASKKKVMTDIFAKGDKYFMSGDLLRMDEEGYLYFCDRIGDTFRWKGENVSTTEVESVFINLLQLKDVVVYGVEVPGSEGRAGMAAIQGTKDSVDWSSLAQQLFLSLPAYAVPLFVRLIESAELTGTFKLKKVKLRNEGFNIALPDPLFILDVSHRVYQPLTVELYQQVQDRKLRL